jgi:hypothetical protein
MQSELRRLRVGLVVEQPEPVAAWAAKPDAAGVGGAEPDHVEHGGGSEDRGTAGASRLHGASIGALFFWRAAPGLGAFNPMPG